MPMTKNTVSYSRLMISLRLTGYFVLVMMTDPAVAYAPGQGYAPYDNGKALDVWLKAANGSDSLGVVWPGEYTLIYKFPVLIVAITGRRCNRFPRLVFSMDANIGC